MLPILPHAIVRTLHVLEHQVVDLLPLQHLGHALKFRRVDELVVGRPSEHGDLASLPARTEAAGVLHGRGAVPGGWVPEGGGDESRVPGPEAVHEAAEIVDALEPHDGLGQLHPGRHLSPISQGGRAHQQLVGHGGARGVADDDVVAAEAEGLLQSAQGGPDIMEMGGMGRVPQLLWRGRRRVLRELRVRAQPIIDRGVPGDPEALGQGNEAIQCRDEVKMSLARIAPCATV